MKKYIPNMGKTNVMAGETLLFPFRTLSNEISKITGEVVTFGKTKDGFEYGVCVAMEPNHAISISGH
ncbi:hypothetical protein MKY31_30280 [Bacillus sp. FSL M8-0139]|uniref:hypothetical protein n=1 Tax=Bacillus sp. FSL M8-0139 TaxID=2921613 RepID=UPI0030FAD85F